MLRTNEQRIQIDPGGDRFVLCWDPDHTVDAKQAFRTRRKVLEPGASVEIFGAFEPGPAPKLVPPRGGRLLVSKRPLAPKLAG